MPSSSPLVAILLATHQGEAFLPAQLASIAAQTYRHWQVWASDDRSQDRTLAILRTQRDTWGQDRLNIVEGPGAGADENFRSLTARTGIQADAFAYCDQDDVWEADKLERAVGWLETIPESLPAIYCSRTRLIDREDKPLGMSPLFSRPPSFANALVQNIAGGNTMVFNRAARDALVQSFPAARNVVIYDWWTYLLVAGAGGRMYYDPHPTVRYRQHAGNLVGSNTRAIDRAASFGHVLKGRFKEWNDRHTAALAAVGHLLTPDARETLSRFAAARRRWLLPRIVGLYRSGVYRQTVAGRLGIAMAAVLNRV